MSKKKKKKAGIGAIFARILVVILTMAVGGIASFFAVRQFFSYKFAKEKKKEVSQQLEKENKDRVDVALMQAGDMMTIRVYHSKNNQMVYIPLCSDMVLNLTDDGKRAVEQELGESVDTAEVSDVIKAMNDDGNTMKEQVEETLGITINSYELIKDDDLVDIINDAGTIQADLSQTISYEDQDGKSVTLTSGENTVDGDAVLALVSNEANIEDEDVHMKLIGDILVQASKTVTSMTSSDFENYVKNYYSKADSDTKYSDVSDNLEQIQSIEEDDINYLLLDGKESGGKFKVDTDAAKKVFDVLLAEDGDIDSVLKAEDASTEKTTEAATEDTEDSSKSITIEIQNSTKISGLASRWKDKLTEDGYSIGSVKTNRQGELTHTKIIIAEKGLGQDLKSYFKNPEYEVGQVSSGAKICIVLGTEDEI